MHTQMKTETAARVKVTSAPNRDSQEGGCGDGARHGDGLNGASTVALD
jgi:hypothetical protein